MNARLWKSLLPLLVLACASAAVAADASDEYSVFSLSPYAGATYLSDDIGLEDDIIFGGRAAVLFLPWLGLEGTYGFSDTEQTGTAAATKLHHLGADLVLNLRPFEKVNPYLTAGWAQLEAKGDWLTTGKTEMNGWEAGAGLKIRLGGDNINRRDLRLEVRDVMSSLVSGLPNNGDMTHNLIATAGLNFGFGRCGRDADHDGVRDGDDGCPETPAGATVDAQGCPFDSDGDGVFDGLDQCAETPRGANVDSYGCPTDGDGDGVLDGLDKCPDSAPGAVVDARGCVSDVDTDGDGVFDSADKCPATPAGAKVDGSGCPLDSDRDGVYDGLDQCPETPQHLKVDAEGCPIAITATETQLLDTGMIRTTAITFKTASAELDQADTREIDEIGATLVRWPELQIEIGGHTDSQGADAANQQLSERRAQTVLDYLVAKFPEIRTSQFSVKGYGETQPLADNATVDGRAQNRRVEFKVLNAETIKRVIESQKLLER
ncbi:MAG: OmpA family protein [bacterium]|nr:OmpA family protein [bacterium]